MGLYRYRKNGAFDKYQVETWTNQNFSTFWQWNVDESSIAFPIRNSEIDITKPQSLIDHLSSELSKFNGFLDYEKRFEKQNDLELGLGIRLGVGVDISTKFVGMVRSEAEKGTFSAINFKDYPIEKAPIPANTLCSLNEINDNIIKPAIEEATRELFQVAEIVEEKTIEIVNTAANALFKIVSQNPLSTAITHWAGTWEESVKSLQTHLARPAKLLAIQEVPSGAAKIYGVGGFYHLQPEEGGDSAKQILELCG